MCTLSVPISIGVPHACSIDKERVSLLEEGRQILSCRSPTFQLHLPVLLAVQLPADMFDSRPKDFHPQDVSAETFIVSLVEMTIWSFLHRLTTISTSGLCLTVTGTTCRSTSRFLPCVDTKRKSSPFDTTLQRRSRWLWEGHQTLEAHCTVDRSGDKHHQFCSFSTSTLEAIRNEAEIILLYFLYWILYLFQGYSHRLHASTVLIVWFCIQLGNLVSLFSLLAIG